MNALMQTELMSKNEAFVTHCTNVGFFIAVCALLVNSQRGRMGETYITLLTSEFLFASVNPLMNDEVCLPLECLGAHSATERFLFTVTNEMASQITACPEFFITQVARVRFFARVNPFVLRQFE